MSELFMMTTITSRNMVTKFLSFYKKSQMAVSLVTLGGGQLIVRCLIILDWSHQKKLLYLE